MASSPVAAEGPAFNSTHRLNSYSSASYTADALEKVETRADDEVEEVAVPAERSFRPINTSRRTNSQIGATLDRTQTAELTRLATYISRRDSLTRKDSLARSESTAYSPAADALGRKDTLAGLEYGDPVLDPSSPQFDVYKWARMIIRTAQDEGVKERRAGILFKDLNISGSGSSLNLQTNVGSLPLAPFRIGEYFSMGKKPKKQILRNFDGVVKSGEMLVVLGRPGSGCSTLLKSVSGELHGLDMEKGSTIHYNGIPQQQMIKEFKGELVYNQEVDKHFPHLTVGQTLEFAAAVRTPHNRVRGLSRQEWVKQLTQVMMAVFGLTHTYNTKVGNDFVRGVSGGERKRVSIAEMALSGAPIACWDNSTRGLDAATALEFTKALRMSSNLQGTCHAVAIYQASQAIYDVFDKVVVLYEGREIYFGPTDAAKAYFENMGWYCPTRQTTGDFLTSVTNPLERKAREGFEKRVPRTSDEFVNYWRASNEYAALQEEIKNHEIEFPIGGKVVDEFKESRLAMQAQHVRPTSPYTISIPMQVRLNTIRAYQRLWNDKVSTITAVIGQIIMSLIIGSIFYNTPETTAAFFAKGSVLFFAILLNALMAITEINTLYDQRPIVEKHASYAFYHPFTEAVAGIVADIPVKFVIASCFNLILYFLAGLRRTPQQFFIFFVFAFVATLTMSQLFRFLAASTKTISQALALAGVLVLAVVIYTGFTIPGPYMHPWLKWISYINPVGYAFEALMVNEFHGVEYVCASLVPAYPNITGDTFVCSVPGAVVGQTSVTGDAFLQASYQYSYSHLWRNFGFMWAFLLFFLALYLVSTEVNSASSSTAEFLIFRRGHVPKHILDAEKSASGDEELTATQTINAVELEESQNEGTNVIPPQKDIFTWRNVTYDIKIKGEPRRLLDQVSGWVKPGTLTALMGVSGAGKTTLLDVLAHRTSIGVITGDMLVNGRPLDDSFQRKTGYVQQQDLHLETSTVREALRFSAMLRQPKSVSKKEKYEYVEDVIKMLSMQSFAEAVVGIPGEGLNVEQRKLLTIGVELAAKPALLLFLDEPTSGLDSQSSWAIVAFLRKLADNGQAVLSTIHQPSSILFQEFDRLLFLAKGGKTVYFGNVGKNSEELLDYFESHGARKCGPTENPAEYMLEIIGAGAGGKAQQDWPEVWKGSEASAAVQTELNRIHEETSAIRPTESKQDHSEFAMPFVYQLYEVTVRVFQQYWRTPSYVYGKFMLGIASALFIGFSFFQSDNSLQGLQNVLFSIFMITAIFSTLVQQIMPRFVTQRSLYEVRERPSKAYSWAAFLIANIFVEIPYQIMLGILVFASYYYSIFGIQSAERQGLILIFLIEFFIFASTFAHMLIAALPDAETAGQIATLLFSLTLTFNGVLQSPDALPRFWIFMYYVSPLTYLVQGMAAAGLHDRKIECSDTEVNIFNPPNGTTCGDYMAPYLSQAPGSLYNPSATADCRYCSLDNADQFLAGSKIEYSFRWRNIGLMWAYIVFNITMAVFFYYAFRVKKWSIKDLGKIPHKIADMVGGALRGMFVRKPTEDKKGREHENHRIL